MTEVIYRNEDFAIINKPAGLMIHGDGRTKEKTLVDFLLETFPGIKEIGEPMELPDGQTIWRPGIVHRLDKETSGILMIALNQEYFEKAKNFFKNREIQKTYHTFVYGNIKEDEGKINFSIGRSKKDFRQWQTGNLARGELRDALTYFKVLERSSDKKITFLEVEPQTGRTHQIRVHMRALQHPVVADSLYAPNMPKALGFKRLALHAYKLAFKDGINNYEFIAPYPEDFEKAIKNSCFK